MPALDNEAYQHFAKKKQRLEDALKSKPSQKLALQKSSSNLFRKKNEKATSKIDVHDFNAILSIDKESLVADVEGMATYETIVAATLRHHTLPCVVPELKSITIGGAIVGLGIESSSFQYGLVHESILEMEILLGSGTVVLCTKDNEFRDLFFGIPNSYGSLGYILRVKFKLIPVKKGLKLTHYKYSHSEDFFAALESLCRENQKPDLKDKASYIEGSIFSADEMYVTTGQFVDDLPYTSHYNFMQIYYQSVRLKKEDFLTTSDYMWRWDTDWFWCSKIFGMENRLLRFLFGKWMLHSAVYAKLLHFVQRRPYLEKFFMQQQESIIQDILIPSPQADEFFKFLQQQTPIYPMWICPMQSWNDQYDFCPLKKDLLYLDFGLWGRVSSHLEKGFYNQLIEQKTVEMQGLKSLYSACYYTEKEFWSIYNQSRYNDLREKYHASQTFLNLYDKCCSR